MPDRFATRSVMYRRALGFVGACVAALLFGPTVTAFASTAWWMQSNSSASQVAKYSDVPRWHLDGGLAVENNGKPDKQTPSGLQFIAGPGAQPGVAVAAGTSGIWRRDASGQWQRSLILLPQGLLTGPPNVTAVVAFAKPLSDAIYLATDGQGVLITNDGGQSWVRDDLGLPSHVLSLSVSSSQRALYAVTDDGVWVHHLQSFPGPPSYPPQDLLFHWLTIAVTTFLALAAAVVALRKVCASGADRDAGRAPA